MSARTTRRLGRLAFGSTVLLLAFCLPTGLAVGRFALAFALGPCGTWAFTPDPVPAGA
jgi:hypothetical protein